MNIVCLDGYTLNPGDISWEGVEALGSFKVYDRTPPDLVLERAREADILLTNKSLLPREIIEQLPNLKYISVLATGFNVVDVDACRERSIPVSNVPVYGTDTVAQYTFALLLELCHNVAHHSARVRDGEWARRGDFCFWDFPLIELKGLNLAIIGFGKIGRRTGELASAFGMNVLACDINQGEAPGYPVTWLNIPEAFEQADVVSLHCPLTDQNKGFVDQALISRMKPSAILINTSRGLLINEADLAAALTEGTLAGAAVDVVSEEPVRRNNPLLQAPNMIITPHMAWGTLSARSRLMNTTVENLTAFLDGAPIHVVNGV